jgi:hypothetical protein
VGLWPRRRQSSALSSKAYRSRHPLPKALLPASGDGDGECLYDGERPCPVVRCVVVLRPPAENLIGPSRLADDGGAEHSAERKERADRRLVLALEGEPYRLQECLGAFEVEARVVLPSTEVPEQFRDFCSLHRPGSCVDGDAVTEARRVYIGPVGPTAELVGLGVVRGEGGPRLPKVRAFMDDCIGCFILSSLCLKISLSGHVSLTLYFSAISAFTRWTVPEPTPCSRAIAWMPFLPARRDVLMAFSIAGSIRGRPRRLPWAFRFASAAVILRPLKR